MQKKLKRAIITTIAVLAGLLFGGISVNAQTVTVSPSKTIYTINGSKRMYRYVDSAGNYQNLFCYDQGGVLNDGTVYTVMSNVYDLNDNQITEIFGSKQNYNKTLWLIDNMYLSEGQNKEELDAMVYQLKQAVHSETALNAVRSKYNVPALKAGDMDNVINHVYLNGWHNVFYSVEQCVLWNYTVNTRQYSGLTSLNGGYDLQGKYYMWLYTALKAVADTKGNYQSPNKNNGVQNSINSLNMDSSSAKIDVANRKVGPFIVNGYNAALTPKIAYSVSVNGTTLNSSDYQISFDGKNLYITISNSKYNLNVAKVNVSMNVKAIKTTATLLYRSGSQDVVAFHKNVIGKNLPGSVSGDNSEFDLRLVKNIAGVWSVSNSEAQVKYDMNSDILKTRKIERVSSLKGGSKTESWKINKYPVTVSTGDIVKYQITVVNEGNLNGYATQIKDYIADGLELVSKEELVKLGILDENSEYYGWTKGNSSNGFTELYTNYLADKELVAYNKSTDSIDLKTVYVYCKVTNSTTGALLKNVAEISEDKTSNSLKQDVNDRDSTPGNIQTSKLSSTWKGNEKNSNILDTNISEQYYYPGVEDDDDFDTVRVQNFDLSLTKEITEVQYKDKTTAELSRLTSINREKLMSNRSTSTLFTMDKSLVNVDIGSIVTYKISVYNEGNVDGYAQEITDYLPNGLAFWSSNVNGVDYNWKVTHNDDGTTTITTDYLANEKINAITNSTMDSKFVEVKCRVVDPEIEINQSEVILTNVAEITKYGYYAGNSFVEANKEKVDRDSVQKTISTEANTAISEYEKRVDRSSRSFKEDYNYQDDDDYENVVLVLERNLDLALRKSISAVNGENVINDYDLAYNRLPRVDASSASKALSSGNAQYYHNKESVKVKVGDEITYTIRVFNEGNSIDYYGYAQTITDYLPQGVEFIKIADSSADKWNTKSKAGDRKVVLEYTANNTIPSDSILKIYADLASGKTLLDDSDYYQTVSIICKVTDAGNNLTNRAEISSEVATDEEGNIIKDVKDRDSVPGSLGNRRASVDTYYDEYNRIYGIDDTYIVYYPGEEFGHFEDDVDFEAITVEPEIKYGKVGIFKYEDTNKNGQYDSEDKALRGAKFALKDNLNSDEFVTEELETNDFGKVIFDGLELDKTYYIVETYSPIGFKKLESAIETVSKAEDVDFEDITNLVKVGNQKETTELNGTKTWNDGGNQDGKRPKTLTVYLLADGIQVDSQVISEENNWSYSFKNLDKFNGEKEILYTVDESEVENYTKTIEGNNLINTYVPETTELSGTKTWNDGGNQDGKRPKTLTVYLLADGVQVDSQVISEETNWSYSFTKLAKYKEGKEIVYTVDESEVENYTKTIEGNNLINTYVPETTELSGTKTWNDGGNQDGKRPKTLTVYLLADGVQVDSQVISEETNWSYSFTKLAKYKEGKEIVYTVDESEVENYTKTIIGNNLVNTYIEPETTHIDGTKTWNDFNDEDGIRPETLTVYLLANGVIVDSREISEETAWSYHFPDLRVEDEKGNTIVYTIDESEVEGYTKKIEGYNLINTHNPETTEVNGIKTWVDNGNQYGKRPETLTVYLLANGERIDSQVISEENGWTYQFPDLKPKDENGNVIEYTVDESEVEDYIKTIVGNNLYNTYKPETTEVSGQKTWNDEDDADGIRPAVIQVILYANGQRYTSTLATAESNWSYSFPELPKFDNNGKKIEYTVDETEVPGYTKTVEGYDLINTHKVTKKADLALRKFITEINGIGLESSREPQVDESTIATKGTATYTHSKEALTVNTGDVVTYTLRIYNEGEIDAYASLVKDDIPEGLEFIVNDATNAQYRWKMLDARGNETSDVSKAKFVITDYLSNSSEENLIKAYSEGNLDYRDVKVSFKVVSKDTTEKEHINYAQISEETDSEGNVVEDTDSTANVWIDGEDDQDIEKIKLTYSDLALRKFITNVNANEVTPSRAPVVDTAPLLNGQTTATYTHPKDVVNVSKDDIVRYTLRIYNEGTKNEYVTLVKDDIPEGLEFVTTSELNQKYGWKMVDELGNEVQYAENAKYVVTNYLQTSLLKAFNKETGEIQYVDVELEFRVVAPEKTTKIMTNYAQISDHTDENGNAVTDRDSTPDKWIDGEDDQDIENVKLTYADLALKKFITEVDGTAITPERAPQVDVTNLVNGTSTEATYTMPKDVVEVQENDIVVYTLRIFNEGTKSLYASEVKDDIPEGLEFVPYTEGDGSINATYRWKLVDENGNVVTDVNAAKYIVTDYLANDLIKAFDKETMTELDYRDVKVAFKVLAAKEKDKVITNYAQISKETDQNKNDVNDIDSTANVWNDGEDDQDTEKIKLKYFDLALKKWVSKAIVIDKGNERVVETGYTEETNPEPVVKIDLKKSKIEDVVVKFEYKILVRNEGEVAGYADEVEDIIPEGLKFVQEDNQNWEQVDGRIVTHELKDTLLEPGDTATVTIVLTWINKSNNLGLKTNIAEISRDSDSKKRDITDIDSTPGNHVPGEDDIDDATVMLTIKTGEAQIYTGLIIAVIAILSSGIIGIKKYVLR